MKENTDTPKEENSSVTSTNSNERKGEYKKKPFHKKNFVYRKKFCYFKKNNIEHIDYKDITLLTRFLGRSGQITPRRFTGTSAKYQRKLSNAVKRARFMALIPYVGVVVNEYYENRQRERRNYERNYHNKSSDYNNSQNQNLEKNSTVETTSASAASSETKKD